MAGNLEKTKTPGIYRKHRASCSRSGRCSCPYQASVWSAREKKLIRKHFDDYGAARTWRQDAQVAIRENRLRAPTKRTVDDAGDELVAGMKAGAILDRSGKPYKPSTIRSYERVLRLHVRPRLGHVRVSALDRAHVQKLVDTLMAEGKAPSTVQNALNPLQVICRRAVHAGEIAVDPTDGLMLPAVRGRRERIAGVEEADRLLDALPLDERPLWATALFAGLRRGELRALRWEAVDFDAGVIRVERAWDDDEGEIEVKSDAGRRAVPLAGRLRSELRALKLRSGRRDQDLVFGRTAADPFVPTTVRSRALRAWKSANEEIIKAADEEGRDVRAGELLEPLTPHEARHCAASYLIAAGLNAKELSVYIGHSDIRTTYNRYGHLMPGGEAAAAAKLDAFLDGVSAAEG